MASSAEIKSDWSVWRLTPGVDEQVGVVGLERRAGFFGEGIAIVRTSFCVKKLVKNFDSLPVSQYNYKSTGTAH